MNTRCVAGVDQGAYDMFTGSDIHGATLGTLEWAASDRRSRAAVRAASGAGYLSQRSRLDAAAEQALGARYVRRRTLQQADHLMLVLRIRASRTTPSVRQSWR